MKELKMFVFFPRTIYSIINSNRHENINIIMISEKLSPGFSPSPKPPDRLQINM